MKPARRCRAATNPFTPSRSTNDYQEISREACEEGNSTQGQNYEDPSFSTEEIHTHLNAPGYTGFGASAKPSVSPRLARVVGITPQDRVLLGYRELDVRAIQAGDYAGRHYEPGDVFRIALAGEGEPPVWVRPT